WFRNRFGRGVPVLVLTLALALTLVLGLALILVLTLSLTLVLAHLRALLDRHLDVQVELLEQCQRTAAGPSLLLLLSLLLASLCRGTPSRAAAAASSAPQAVPCAASQARGTASAPSAGRTPSRHRHGDDDRRARDDGGRRRTGRRGCARRLRCQRCGSRGARRRSTALGGDSDDLVPRAGLLARGRRTDSPRRLDADAIEMDRLQRGRTIRCETVDGASRSPGQV